MFTLFLRSHESFNFFYLTSLFHDGGPLKCTPADETTVFANIISLWSLWNIQTVLERTLPCSLYSSRRHLSLSILFVTFPPTSTPLRCKTKFMSPCISLGQTDGFTHRPRRIHTARQSDCFFYATLFMLYSLILDTEALFFCTLLLFVSLLWLFFSCRFYSLLNFSF